MKTKFVRDQWNPQDWMLVRCPLGHGDGLWVQKKDCIINYTPENALPEELCEGGKYAGDTFASMILKERFNSSVKALSTMSFDHKMAPLVFVANEIDTAIKVPVLGERYEVVLYYKGINIWEHFQQDGKVAYNRKLFCGKSLLAKQKYLLELMINPNEKSITITLGEICFKVHTPLLGDSYYIGIMGCEGVNRFYDFEVTNL
jgi:hypothetical protein